MPPTLDEGMRLIRALDARDGYADALATARASRPAKRLVGGDSPRCIAIRRLAKVHKLTEGEVKEILGKAPRWRGQLLPAPLAKHSK